MTFTKRILAAAVVLAAATSSSSHALAQDKMDRTVEQYACKDVMRDSDSNRRAAIAFLHGFLLGKSGSSKFNLETLTKQTDAFIDRCLDNPKEKAAEIMMKIKK